MRPTYLCGKLACFLRQSPSMALALWLAACLLGLPLSAPAADRTSANPAVQALNDLFAEQWEYEMEHNPTYASSLGDRRWNSVWDDVSLSAIDQNFEHVKQLLERLQKIDRSQLPPRDQLNYDLFKKRYAQSVEAHPFRMFLVPLTMRDGIQTSDDLASSLRFETVRDYEDWIGRLRSFGVYMDQTIALMREGIKERIVQPKIVMERIPGQVEKQIVTDPAASPFYEPFKKFASGISPDERARLDKSAKEAIAEYVLPAFKRFQEFFNHEYLPACFDQVGAWQLPQGDRIYAMEARHFTTTDLTPQQIHEIGLGEVKRIRAEMEAVKERVKFKGTLPEFFEYLRNDKQFYFQNPDDLLAAYRALVKRVDPLLVKVFKTLPRMPYGVEPIPDLIAPDTTTAYYREPADDGSRAGTFFVNLYRPETRPKYEMMALSLHESVPGHHLQIALAQEQGALPNFRRHGGYTAFVEGWGLYSESLGEELGLYDDPYSKFGQLTYEMWRAVRLVVDTGMHQMKWDRQKAIDYFKANAAKQENDIVNEIDRYIGWPGQALAYKIGELKIKELRARARRELGDKFDLREFHDTVLLNGAVPLDILEHQVNDWIKSKSQARVK